MATRATYKIGTTTFYCHWDGYPTGAALRFANMIAALTVPESGDRKGFDPIETRRGGLAFAFIRGNLDAEPTEGHTAHGDTEYRYTVTSEPDGAIKIEVRAINANGEWKFQSYSDLAEWLNGQRPKLASQIWSYYSGNYPGADKSKTFADAQEEALECIPEIVRCELPREYTTPMVVYATKANALAIKHNCAKIAATFGDDNPNKKIYVARMRAWRDAIAALEPKTETASA